MVHYVAYVSTAVQRWSTEALHVLLEQCRAQNERAGVTGALLYHDGTFMQVIEGDEATLAELYAAIAADPRHRDVDLLMEGDTPERQFSDWSMAFRDLTAATDELATGFSRFINDSRSPTPPTPSIGYRLLLAFRRTLNPRLAY